MKLKPPIKKAITIGSLTTLPVQVTDQGFQLSSLRVKWIRVYLEGQGDLVSGLKMGIARVTILGYRGY